jgi:hypothetical protein
MSTHPLVPGFDWKSWVAPIITAAIVSFGGSWLGDHFAFAQIKEEFKAVADKVSAMPPPDQIIPRIEIEQMNLSTDRRLVDLQNQLQRVEQKQDRIIELMLEEARANQRISRMSTAR